jgi:hypothetical protein
MCLFRIHPLVTSKTLNCKPLPRVYHGATSINNEKIVIFGGINDNQANTAFYVLKPTNIKLELDIEEED